VKSLLFVCRQLHAAVLPMINEDAAFWAGSELSSFVRSTTDLPDRAQSLKHLEVHGPASGLLAATGDSAVTFPLHTCTNLTSLLLFGTALQSSFEHMPWNFELFPQLRRCTYHVMVGEEATLLNRQANSRNDRRTPGAMNTVLLLLY
jgi:hypothetical protein